jgi:hypothetical protein
MTNDEYLTIMCEKVMEKVVVKVIKETHCKEMEKNKAKRSTTYFNVDEWAFLHVATKSARVDFEYNWFPTIVKETW